MSLKIIPPLYYVHLTQSVNQNFLATLDQGLNFNEDPDLKKITSKRTFHAQL